MDFKALGEHLGLDEDEYIELVELFVQTGKSDHGTLVDAISANDMEAVKRTAHTMAGAAGNLGLMELHKAAKNIENNAEQIGSSELENAAKGLKDGIDQIEAQIAS